MGIIINCSLTRGVKGVKVRGFGRKMNFGDGLGWAGCTLLCCAVIAL
jgi:hypothetical protein